MIMATDKGQVRVDEVIPFYEFAQLLEKASHSSNIKDKIERLSRFITRFREAYFRLHETMESNEHCDGDSIFSIIRLLYPMLDKKRASYNFKCTGLSKMFAKILGLDKNSEEGRKLIDYKEPVRAGFGSDDLGLTVFAILNNRFSHQGSTTGGPTLSELHSVLDQLARDRNAAEKGAVTQENQIKILQGFVRKLTPLEGKWLVRILLKNLLLDIKKAQIFNLIHPKAAELMNTLDLEGVCKRLNDPAASLSSSDISDLTLFTYFKPMLCTRLDEIDDSASKDIGNADEEDEDHEASTSTRKKSKLAKKTTQKVKLPIPPFILETKWDGERFQIHYQYDETGVNENEKHKFKYISRNGHDYTSAFMKTLSPRLISQFVDDPPVKSFIIDGEMMAWNKDTKSFTQKSGNIDVKTLTPESKQCPLFIAFDIVYYNGEGIEKKPMNERIEYLKQVLSTEESTCQFSEQTIVQDKAHVTDAMNDAIDKLEEGLVVKAMDSVYQPGKRGLDWLKVKPEYIEGHSVEDLDLLIMGAFYSDSKTQRGSITNFLVGLVGDNKREFYPLATVGFGSLKFPERQELVSNLRDLFITHEVSSVKYGRRKKPDLFIDPKRSVVLQVKASEIISSKEYEVDHSLRFPRVTKVRYDKNWDDAMSVHEFLQLQQSCDGKLAKKKNTFGRSNWFNKRTKSEQDKDKDKGGDSSDDNQNNTLSLSPSKKLRLTTKTTSPKKSSSLMALTSTKTIPGISKVGNTRVKSTLFAGHVFCIIANAGGTWQNEVTLLIKAHGGEIISNPCKDIFCIIAEIESQRVKNYYYGKDGSEGPYNVTNGRLWIDKCLAANKILEFQPEDLFFANQATKDSFSKDFDKYGDSFTKTSTVQEVKNLIKGIIEKEANGEEEPTTMESKEAVNEMKKTLDEELFPSTGIANKAKVNKWSFLSDYKIAFRGTHPNQSSLTTQIEFYGGDVAENESEDDVTHVVLSPQDSPGKLKQKPHISAFVVSYKWLLDSLGKKEIRPEMSYLIK